MRGKRIGQSFALRREYEKSKKKRLGKKKKRESRKTKNFALSRAFGNTFCEIAHLKSRPAASDTVKTAAKAWERLFTGAVYLRYFWLCATAIASQRSFSA